ncbi:hypothetical protein [Tepidibacter thalassicus]|uniref:Uncharacterized protein n=1 Tax=Tepidibacter thalassicus DSM 15285 TaxID=1123350 RepID=A0A1M5SXC2_9FIRM|nr:hypothetical protein [Tepidibacter thalassicus]SHH43204.1 hypothetical protein SAMN02744040_01954 [Tepidibacter thalassicus DSM 15285]
MGTRYYAPILVKFKEGKDLAVKPEGDLYIAHITGEKPKTAVRVDFRMKNINPRFAINLMRKNKIEELSKFKIWIYRILGSFWILITIMWIKFI